jgi:A/G-specific adenine glycosylase
LQAAAIQIVENYGGIIPDTVEILLELPGIGPYTARAVASFAYRKPEAVLDGNVFRVLSRLYADPTAIDLPGSRGHFQALADAALGRLPDPAGQSSDFNNAIMDLGATVCTPRAPRCSDCPLQEDCAAYHLQRVQDFPVKAKTKTRRDRYYIYYIIRNYNGQWLMRQRNDASFWKQLWVPPMLETDTQPDGFAHPQHLVGRLVHEFTHFRMHCFLVEVQTLDFKLPPKDFDAQPEKWLHPDDLTELALPTAIHKLLELWRLPRQTDLF